MFLWTSVVNLVTPSSESCLLSLVPVLGGGRAVGKNGPWWRGARPSDRADLHVLHLLTVCSSWLASSSL